MVLMCVSITLLTNLCSVAARCARMNGPGASVVPAAGRLKHSPSALLAGLPFLFRFCINASIGFVFECLLNYKSEQIS